MLRFASDSTGNEPTLGCLLINRAFLYSPLDMFGELFQDDH